MEQKSGFLLKQKPNYKLEVFLELIELGYHNVQPKIKGDYYILNKTRKISKKVLLGMSLALFLGFLLLAPPLQGAAEILEIQQQPDHPKPGEPFEIPGNGSSLTLTPGEELILETPSGVSIQLVVNEGVDISVLESDDLPEEAGALPEQAQGLGRYLSIELSDSDVDVGATISMPYTEGELPSGVAEDQLFFAFYNASTGEWQGIPSWVDTTKNIVYANTDHFSTWTVLGESASPSTTSSLWLELNNVKDGFLISFTVLSLFLVIVALVSRRQK